MKQPIRVYTHYLDLLTESDSYQSLQFERDYHNIGAFELHINRYMQGAEHFQKGNIIALNKQSNKVGLIFSREIELDENGKQTENFIIKGDSVDCLMNRRITVPPADTSHDRKSGAAETVMKHYVYNNFVNPADGKRIMKHFEIAPNKNRGNPIKWESRYKNVAEELNDISIKGDIGWGVFVDFKSRKFIFDVIEAKDRTQSNADGNAPVFFSPEFETIKSQTFVDSDQDLRTVAYVGGQGEGVDRKIIELGDDTGWDRIETFIDARDLGSEDEDEEKLSDEEIEQLLLERGQSKMAEMDTLLSLEAEIMTPVSNVSPFQYENDFDLGDKVDVVNKSWGVTMQAPIVKIKEIHEPGGFRLEATFGEDRPTLISKIKDKFDELEGVDKQESPAKVAVQYAKDAKKHADRRADEAEDNSKQYADEQDKYYDEVSKEFASNRAKDALKDAVDEAKRQDDLVRQEAIEYATKAEQNAKDYAVAKEEYNKRVEEIRNEFSEQSKRIEEINIDLEEGIKVDVSTLRKDVDDNFSRIDDANAQLEVHSKAIAQRVTKTEFDEAEERITDAEGKIETIAGQVRLKASQEDFNNVEGRVTAAEGELKVLPGQIDAKVSKDGVVGAINATPEKLLIDFGRVKMEGALEARHIKSLNGLNVGDQFIVDNGNVTFAGDLKGASGTFKGSVEARQLIVDNPDIEKEGSVGLRLQTAQWQSNVSNPYRKTGYMEFNTGNDGLDIYKVGLDGKQVPMDHVYMASKVIGLDGRVIVGQGSTGGMTQGVEFPSLHVITTSNVNGNFVLAGNRSAGSPFEVKSHEWGDKYRTDLEVRNDGALISTPTASATSTGSANVRIGASNGKFVRSSSSAKYKILIEDVKVDPYKILELYPRDWYDKENTETYADCLSCHDWEKLDDVEEIRRTPGLVGEEVEAVGLSQYVEYSVDGEIQGVMYDRLWTLLIPIISDLVEQYKDLQNQIEKQQEKINRQQKKIDNQDTLIKNLLERVKALESA